MVAKREHLDYNPAYRRERFWELQKRLRVRYRSARAFAETS